MPHVERITGTGVVHVELLVIFNQAVVGLVVDALEAQGGAQVVTLGGVVVHHIEDYFDADVMERPHHSLEFLHLLAEVAHGGILVVGGEEADRVVAPVVAQTLLEQGRVLHELVHRHELDGRGTDALHVLDDGGVGEPGIGAALLLGHLGVQLREALDVRLVDNSFGIGNAGMPIAGPVEEGVDDDTEHHVSGRVLGIDRQRVTEVVGEQ